MRSRRVIVLAVVLLALVAPTGCSKTAKKAAPKSTSPSASVQPSATASTPPSTGSIAGAWNGTFTVTGQPGQGTFTVTFATAGSALTGKIHINNSTCVTDGTISGTLNGNQINFGAVRAAQKISFTGALVGGTLAGAYSAPACPGRSGNWAATRA